MKKEKKFARILHYVHFTCEFLKYLFYILYISKLLNLENLHMTNLDFFQAENKYYQFNVTSYHYLEPFYYYRRSFF